MSINHLPPRVLSRGASNTTTSALGHGSYAELQQQIIALRAEIERLNSCLRYEQHRADRIGTCGPGCETWGAAHYECAMQEIERLNASRHELQAEGTHPAPCARHCEATAFQIEIRNLRSANLDVIAHFEQMREDLAACREREARMRKLVGFLLIVARTAGDAMPETHARIVSEAEAALDEGAQG